MTPKRVIKMQREHPLEWVFEPLLDDPTAQVKAWFGGKSIMTAGMHRLFIVMKEEPWRGILVCTCREHQETLLKDFPFLRQHPVLGKWLYLSESAENFERDAKRLARQVKNGDPRIGIAPTPRKKAPKRRVKFGDKL